MTITITSFLASNSSAINTDAFIPNWSCIHNTISTLLVINHANDYQNCNLKAKLKLFFIKFAIKLSIL